MKRYALCAVLFAVFSSALAEPFEMGDTKIGKRLEEQRCSFCHASKFGGDGSSIYTRPNHKIRSVQDLAAQIGRCNEGSHAGLSEDEQRDVGAYLNRSFYKFK